MFFGALLNISNNAYLPADGALWLVFQLLFHVVLKLHSLGGHCCLLLRTWSSDWWASDWGWGWRWRSGGSVSGSPSGSVLGWVYLALDSPCIESGWSLGPGAEGAYEVGHCNMFRFGSIANILTFVTIAITQADIITIISLFHLSSSSAVARL